MVGRTFYAAVVQVETVNVNVCFHKSLNTETAVRRSRPGSPKLLLGDMPLLSPKSTKLSSVKSLCHCEMLSRRGPSNLLLEIVDCLAKCARNILPNFNCLRDRSLSALIILNGTSDFTFTLIFKFVFNHQQGTTRFLVAEEGIALRGSEMPVTVIEIPLNVCDHAVFVQAY